MSISFQMGIKPHNFWELTTRDWQNCYDGWDKGEIQKDYRTFNLICGMRGDFGKRGKITFDKVFGYTTGEKKVMNKQNLKKYNEEIDEIFNSPELIEGPLGDVKVLQNMKRKK